MSEQRERREGRGGFTLIELLVVIGLIALLVGLLLPALNYVQRVANHTATVGQLQSISKACDSYQMTFDAYPGYVDERDYEGDFDTDPAWTSTENLMVSLMGHVVEDGNELGSETVPVPGTSGNKVVDLGRFGEGPRASSGRTYGAFYSPSQDELLMPEEDLPGSDRHPGSAVPDLVDKASGMPILYYRAIGSSGDAMVSNNGTAAYFGRLKNGAYFNNDEQQDAGGYLQNWQRSMISDGDSGSAPNETLAYALGNESMSNWSDGPNNGGNDVPGGAYGLIAASVDGIYFDAQDIEGEGQTSFNSGDDFRNYKNSNHDVVVTGGSF